MKTVWIIGAGQFGEKAAVRLRLKYPEAAIIVVDQDRRALHRVEEVATAVVVGDGAAYLAEHLTVSEKPDWIVAAVPVHLAFEWLCKRLSPAYRIEKLAFRKP
jgi:prephenate dehydrogenase